MKLVSDWKRVLRHAWSIRLIIIAGLFSGVEIAMPYLEASFPPGIFAGLSALATGGAFVSRIVAQKGMYDDR